MNSQATEPMEERAEYQSEEGLERAFKGSEPELLVDTGQLQFVSLLQM